ncbi:MAG: hypothetical protein JO020_10035 [Chloroflexi bacterium]|nr:hypothetical protein [Chloroflexota bacterium]
MIPEWVGWLALGSLVVAFSALAWWLLWSPLPSAPPPRYGPKARRTRYVVAWLVLLSGVLFSAGARWDELWHRAYGGFGDDFLWPPHMLIYGGLALNAGFAGWGLARTLRGRGGLRERFRAEPLLGLLGLIAAYQMASIPSDLIWHVIIGPDITAWSLPHVLLAVTTTGVWIAGAGLALSSSAAPRWRLTFWPGRRSLLVVGLAAIALLALLQIGVTEWEWPDGDTAAILQRPAWSYAVVVLAAGVVLAHTAVFATRWPGAATLTALLAVAGQVVTIVIDRATLGSGPMLSSYLLVLPPAIALDVLYAMSIIRRARPASRVFGALLYALVFLIGVGAMQLDRALPPLQPGLTISVVIIGVLTAVALGPALSRFATWLSVRQAA